MSNCVSELEKEYDQLLGRLGSYDEPASELLSILRDLISVAERGYYLACEPIAELFALAPSVRDPHEAYVWYFVAFKFDGYRTALENQGTSNNYVGNVGDFRNESMVSELVDEIGISRLKDLDRRAEEWIKAHPSVQS